MKFKELVQKSEADLDKLEKETTLELIQENAQVAAGTVAKNPGRISVLKKLLGKIKQARVAKEDKN